jgi:hypothetical protein
MEVIEQGDLNRAQQMVALLREKQNNFEGRSD